MPTDIFRLFTNLGLSETETKIYFASLSLGPASVQDIARKASISRTAAYDAIEALQKHGLMSTHERGKKRVFASEEPERAISHFKERIHVMEEQLETLQKVMPELKVMVGGERPSVRFYEGKEAIYTLFSDVALTAPKVVYEVSNLDDVHNILDPEIMTDARKLLDWEKTQLYVLHRGELHTSRATTKFCRMPDELGDFHGDIWIYENRVAFVTFVGRLMTVIIENQSFADTARTLFRAAWRLCTTEKI